MKTYMTSEVAKIVGVHPNTVRLYEELELIPKTERRSNSYRVFTEFHIEQFQIARLAFQIEVLQNGLRKKIIEMVKVSSTGDFDKAIDLTEEYLGLLQKERRNAEDAIDIVKKILNGETQEEALSYRRKEVSDYLNISMDAIRNWEMNGLLSVKRRRNGYRVYTSGDIKRLKIIRSLRCANYSLEAILRMLNALSFNPNADIKKILNTPRTDEDIISVCDKLISSLQKAENNAKDILKRLDKMKSKFS